MLVIQNTALGDAALLIKHLYAQDLKEYQLYILCTPGLETLWERFFPAAKVKAIPNKACENYPFADTCFRFVFCASMNSSAALIAAKYKTVNRIGLSEKRFPKLSELVYTHRIIVDPDLHVSQRYASLFRIADFSENPDGYTGGSKTRESFVLLHPGAKWKPRRWHHESYFDLAQRFIQSGTEVKILINQSETDLWEYFKSVLKPENILITQNLNDLLQAVSECSCFIGNDSGPMHLSNLIANATICIWGPGNLKRIRPLGNNVIVLAKEISCRPCRQYQDSELCRMGDNICLRQISVDEVYDAYCVLQKAMPHPANTKAQDNI